MCWELDGIVLGRLFESCHFERASCQVSSHDITLNKEKAVTSQGAGLGQEDVNSLAAWAEGGLNNDEALSI